MCTIIHTCLTHIHYLHDNTYNRYRTFCTLLAWQCATAAVTYAFVELADAQSSSTYGVLQNRAVKNLFRSPNMVEDVRGTLTKLERGDLKLRVRALEAERALARVQIMQTVMTTTVVACTLVNMGTILTINAMAKAATASFVGAGVSTVMTLLNYLKVKNLEKKEAQLVGSG